MISNLLFVQDSAPCIRTIKIADALNKSGVKIHLVHRNLTPDEVYGFGNSSFESLTNLPKYNFRDVRLGIESLILDPEYIDDESHILENDEIIRSIEIIKEQLSSEKHWAIFVSNEGDIDYAKTDNKNDEQFLKSLVFFEETKSLIGGFILKSSD